MRIFTNKWFNRWARKKRMPNSLLINAAKEIIAGKVEANISEKEEAALNIAAESFISTTDKQITELLKNNSISEINNDE